MSQILSVSTALDILSNLTTQLCKGNFLKTPHSFCERRGRHTIDIEESLYMVDVMEMASKHISSDAFLIQALKITEAAILVYDVSSPDTFQLAQGVFDFIRENKGDREYGVLLVGNKSDVDDNERQVSWAEGRKAALGFGSLMIGKPFVSFNTTRYSKSWRGRRTKRSITVTDGFTVNTGMENMESSNEDTTKVLLEERKESYLNIFTRKKINSGYSAIDNLSLGKEKEGHTDSLSLRNLSDMPAILQAEKNEPVLKLENLESFENESETTNIAVKLERKDTKPMAREGALMQIIEKARASPKANEETMGNIASIPTHADLPAPLIRGKPSESISEPNTINLSRSAYTTSNAPPRASTIPSPRPATVSFIECSAKTGDNVTAVFEYICREVMRLREINQERKYEAERLVCEKKTEGGGGATGLTATQTKNGNSHGSIWKAITIPWFKRESHLGS